MRVTTRVWHPGGDRRLVCVPFAGGGARSYARLVRSLPPTWTVVTGEADHRTGATPAAVADAWWRAAGGHVGPGDVVFGHSAGAAIVAGIASRHGERLAGVSLVVSAPPLQLPTALLAAVDAGDDDTLLDLLAAAGLLPGRWLARDELKRLVVPRFVRDLHMLRAGWPGPAPQVPVTVLVGSDDPTCRRDDVASRLAGWPVRAVHVVDGGHYFCVDNPGRTAALLGEIAATQGTARG